MTYPMTPRGRDRRMNREFAARISSFLRRDTWWNTVQAIKEVVPGDQLWQTVIAGIDGMTDEDYLFAQAINWAVDESAFDLEWLGPYDPEGNWWYSDIPDAFKATATLAVTGTVRLKVMEKEDVLREKARTFVRVHIDEDHTVGFAEDETKVDPAHPWVSGKVLLK